MADARGVRTFYIATDPFDCGRRFWFVLRVYPTTEMLQRAAHAYRPQSDRYSNAGGVFHGRFSYWFDHETGKAMRHRSTGFIGVMRLSMKNLHRHVVIHESVHAAVTMVQALNVTREVRLGRTPQQMERVEEPLCYATQEISEAVLKATGLD